MRVNYTGGHAKYLIQIFKYKAATYTIRLDLRSNRDTMTVQAPHPPSAHPSFVPGNCTEANRKKYVRCAITRAHCIS